MRRTTPIIVLVGCLLAAETAGAYVLPAEYILRILAEKRRHLGVKDLSIQLTAELASQHAPADERIYLKTPERLRRILQEEETTTVEVIREGKAARGQEDHLEAIKGPVDLLPTLLAPLGNDIDQMQARMVKTVTALGIDTAVTALGRFEDQVCYIIGGRAWEDNVSQLWIDKETFMPSRLILVRGKTRTETRWLEFGSSTTGELFPRVIEVLVDGKRTERATVTKIERNKKVPETLFELR